MTNTTSAAPCVTQTYFCLKSAKTDKVGQRSLGSQIGYRWLTDEARSDLFLQLLSNDSGGQFGKELVPFQRLQECVAQLDDEAAFSTKIFRPAFQRSLSANNPGFAALCLRAEGLISPSPGKSFSLLRTGSWSNWREDLLAHAGEAVEIAANLTPLLPADDLVSHVKPSRRDKRKIAREVADAAGA